MELNIATDEEECKDMIFVIDKSDDHQLQFVEFIEAMTYNVEDQVVDNLMETY